MKLVLAFLILSTSASGSECYKYSNQVTLQGVLTRQSFPEQSNYESVAKGDAKATYFFVSTPKPFCVDSGNETLEPEENQISKVQLILSPDEYSKLRPSLGKVVSCSGSFFHAITGHHHSIVLLDNAKCIQP